MCGALLRSVGDGNVHVMMSINPNDEAEMRAAKKLNERMVERAIEAEGTCTGEHGVGVGKRDFLEHELGVSTVDTMRKLKRALDPHGLMNPGKVRRTAAAHSSTERAPLCLSCPYLRLCARRRYSD